MIITLKRAPNFVEIGFNQDQLPEEGEHLMVSNDNSFNMSIERVSIEPFLKHAIAYRGIIPLLDYLRKIQLTYYIENCLTLSKQGGIFSLADVVTVLFLGR